MSEPVLLADGAVMGYVEKGGYYLPPYNWWADAAAKNLVATVNKLYKNTGFSLKLAEVRINKDLWVPEQVSCYSHSGRERESYAERS